jgi:hypothetical protein
MRFYFLLLVWPCTSTLALNLLVFLYFFVQVAGLFKDHKDLLEEFQHFLPDTSVAPQAVASSRGGLVKREDRSSLPPANRTLHNEKVEMTCCFACSI